MNFPFLEFKDLHSCLLSTTVTQEEIKLKIKRLLKELECIVESRDLEIEDKIKNSGLVLLPKSTKVNSEFIKTTLSLSVKLNINGYKAAQILNFSIENSNLGLNLEENSIVYYNSFKKFQFEILKEILKLQVDSVLDFAKIQKEILKEILKDTNVKEMLEILILIQKRNSVLQGFAEIYEILKVQENISQVSIGLLIAGFYSKNDQFLNNLLQQEWKNDLIKSTVKFFTLGFGGNEQMKKDWFNSDEKKKVFLFLRSLVEPKSCGMENFGFSGK
jgi:hypothetical protein